MKSRQVHIDNLRPLVPDFPLFSLPMAEQMPTIGSHWQVGDVVTVWDTGLLQFHQLNVVNVATGNNVIPSMSITKEEFQASPEQVAPLFVGEEHEPFEPEDDEHENT